MSARLWVIEGVDEVGKSSIAAAVQAELGRFDWPLRLLSFPGQAAGSLGLHIYKMHHAPEAFGITDLTPTSLQVLHLAAHCDSIERTILPLLAADYDVLLDRYWWSMWVYGRAGGVPTTTLDAMVALEIAAWRGVLPACSFLISADTPFQPVADEAGWARIRELYGVLARKETEKYPVQEVRNVGRLEQSVKQIVDGMCSRRSTLSEHVNRAE